jgi:flagellar basal-body rod protein FlgC
MTLSSSFDIAADGLGAHAARLQIHANNIANLSTPNYVRKIPVLAEKNNMNFQDILYEMRSGVYRTGVSVVPSGVALAGTVNDPTPGKRVYMPHHPEADKDGYVTQSNVNVLGDMADATISSRIYEANLAVVGIVKGMANRAMEIGRGQ